MRVLITGSRGWKYPDAIRSALQDIVRETGLDPSEITVVHGGAAGADRMAGAVAEQLGMKVEVHRADWEKFGRSAGFVRNEEMVNLGAEVCLAFWDGSSKGTAHTMNLVLNKGINLRKFKQP